MKCSFVAASMIALGALGLTAPSAFASGSSTVDVPFAGTVLEVCVITPAVTPGVLEPATGDSSTLTSEGQSVTGTLTVLCNTDFDVSVAAPNTTLLTTVDGSGTSEIRSIDNTLGLIAGVAGEETATGLLPNLLHTISVDMDFTKSDGTPYEAGLYTFAVPVTVVCP